MQNSPDPYLSNEDLDDWDDGEPLQSLQDKLLAMLESDDDPPIAAPEPDHEPLTPKHGTPELEIPSSGPLWSSPIKGTKEEQYLIRLRKRTRKQIATISAKRKQQKATEEILRNQDLEDVLNLLKSKNCRFKDLLKYVFDPKNGKGSVYWHEFFVYKGEATQLLDWWTSSQYSSAVREEIQAWAIDYMAGCIRREARTITKTKRFQTRDKTIDEKFISDFSFSQIYKELMETLAPISMEMLTSFSTSRYAGKHGERRRDRTKMVVTSAALACIGEYSHSNNEAKRANGLYLYTSGAQRQAITVLSTFGFCESYTNMVSKNLRRSQKKLEETTESKTTVSGTEILGGEVVLASNSNWKVKTGTLRQLSEALRTRAREIASTGLYMVVYDNINIQLRTGEQVIGHHDTQENGTSATLVPLFDTKIEDMSISEMQDNFLNAEPLKLTDIIHSTEECQFFEDNLVFTILRIIIKNGGDGFKKFEENLKKQQPFSNDKIKLHRTELHPLPAMNIDESTIIGNAKVCEAIYEELQLSEVPESEERIRFFAGDQLSIARLRAVENIRAGQEEGYQGYFWGAWIPCLFHAKIADAHGTLLTHWGTPNTGERNPGSLWFHNTKLDRLPITLTSLPTFRTCRDLIYVSLYARILQCLKLVSKCSSLKEYLSNPDLTWDLLVYHARLIYKNYANSSMVENLRWERKNENNAESPKEGDMVFENAVLFLRDALISREFCDAIKCGDSGRVLLVLKIWALSFRGNGRTKYAYEMLHLIHNITKVWGPKIRDIVLKNWLINPSGNPNSYYELDLGQELHNFWIKARYKAHGSNASWEWLEMMSPCVETLRTLFKSFNDVLGADQGTRHAPPDLTQDIQELMKSLDEHKVYEIQKGRVLKDNEPVKDVIAVGLHNLTEGTKNPLSDYNEGFRRLQTRRRMQPVTRFVPKPPTPPQIPEPNPEATSLSRSFNNRFTGWLNPTLHDTGVHFQPSDEVGRAEEEEKEEGSEAKNILDDLMNGVQEQTLPRLSEEDVEVDMDKVFTEVDDEWSDDSGESESSDSNGTDSERLE